MKLGLTALRLTITFLRLSHFQLGEEIDGTATSGSANGKQAAALSLFDHTLCNGERARHSRHYVIEVLLVQERIVDV